jgi:hypothetical protein
LENSRSLGPMCELRHGMSCHSTRAYTRKLCAPHLYKVYGVCVMQLSVMEQLLLTCVCMCVCVLVLVAIFAIWRKNHVLVISKNYGCYCISIK